MEAEVARYFRDLLKAARATALRDAEGYQEILFTLERLGVAISGKIQNLGKYEPHLTELAKKSSLALEIPNLFPGYHKSFSVLYTLVREARNDALHQGALARHLTGDAVELALIVEDALMGEAKTLGDLMVRQPMCAMPWQPVSFVRQQILANSFSWLPLLLDIGGQPTWHVISDSAIAKYLRTNRKNRNEKLAKKLKDAIDQKELDIEKVEPFHVDTEIGEEVLRAVEGKPVLIVDKGDPSRLMGILTAFDLL